MLVSILCQSMVLSIHNYWDILYYPGMSYEHKNRLQIIQINCVWFIYGLIKFDHVSEKYYILEWKAITDCVKFQYLVFLQKQLLVS